MILLERNNKIYKNNTAAPMAELADALDLGSSEETRTGSIPASRTNNAYLISMHYFYHRVNLPFKCNTSG